LENCLFDIEFLIQFKKINLTFTTKALTSIETIGILKYFVIHVGSRNIHSLCQFKTVNLTLLKVLFRKLMAFCWFFLLIFPLGATKQLFTLCLAEAKPALVRSMIISRF